MRFLIPMLSFFLFVFSCNGFAIGLTDAANKHNLSQGSTSGFAATSETRICVFCHTPHGASADSALWNRNAPLGSFSLYDDGGDNSLNIDDAAIVVDSEYNTTDYPNGASRMCLSCHDGVSAIGDVMNGSAIGMNQNYLSGNAVIDLTTSHPISFVFNGAVRDYLNTPAGGGAAGDYALPGTTIGPLDGNSRMQCTTCHDPHTDTRGGSYNLPFWRNFTGSLNEVVDYDNTCGACHVNATDWGPSWPGPGSGIIH